jgi:hypothetical protein
MKSWLITLAIMALSWHFLNIESSSGFYGVFLPLVFALSLITALTKVVFALGGKGQRGPYSGDGGGDGFWGDGGGDGGCGGD